VPALERVEGPQIQLLGTYNGGLRAEPPAGSRAEPLIRGSGGEPPWSWNTFGFWTFNGSCKFTLFSEI